MISLFCFDGQVVVLGKDPKATMITATLGKIAGTPSLAALVMGAAGDGSKITIATPTILRDTITVSRQGGNSVFLVGAGGRAFINRVVLGVDVGQMFKDLTLVFASIGPAASIAKVIIHLLGRAVALGADRVGPSAVCLAETGAAIVKRTRAITFPIVIKQTF